MKFLKRAWQDIRTGQNLDIYITALLSVVIAIFGVIGIANQSVISATVLAVLALLLSSLLVSRQQASQIQTALTHLATQQNASSQFMSTGDDIAEILSLLRNSQTAYFWGTTFTTHIPLLKQDLENLLGSGLAAKFLLVKPESSALKMAAFRKKDLSAQDLNDDLLRNLKRLETLSNLDAAGKVETRVIDYLAPYVMYVFDPHLSSGQIIMRLSTLHVPDAMRPIIRLSRSQDLEWFDFYVQQFENAWLSAESPASIS